MLDLINKTSTLLTQEEHQTFLDTLSMPHPSTRIVSWLNAHSFCTAQRDPALHECLIQSTYLLRDGIGMGLLMVLAKKRRGNNMNGTDLIPEILCRFKGQSAAVFGTQDPYLSQAVQAIEALGVTVVEQMDGFQPEVAYVARVVDKKIDLILLGMGVPKQEKVSLLLSRNVSRPVVILNGGAILDFMSGRFERAPRIIRTMRMEWLYRLCKEPGRLWKRYIGSLPELIGYALNLRAAVKEKEWK